VATNRVPNRKHIADIIDCIQRWFRSQATDTPLTAVQYHDILARVHEAYGREDMAAYLHSCAARDAHILARAPAGNLLSPPEAIP
jgi:hypothetical protein